MRLELLQTAAILQGPTPHSAVLATAKGLWKAHGYLSQGQQSQDGCKIMITLNHWAYIESMLIRANMLAHQFHTWILGERERERGREREREKQHINMYISKLGFQTSKPFRHTTTYSHLLYFCYFSRQIWIPTFGSLVGAHVSSSNRPYRTCVTIHGEATRSLSCDLGTMVYNVKMLI